MLAEIRCSRFKKLPTEPPAIRFGESLNVVLGDDEGSNSIGKSTFMMIIDFAFGGSDYVKKLTDIQAEIGEHEIEFMFVFDGGEHRFARSSGSMRGIHEESCQGLPSAYSALRNIAGPRTLPIPFARLYRLSLGFSSAKH